MNVGVVEKSGVKSPPVSLPAAAIQNAPIPEAGRREQAVSKMQADSERLRQMVAEMQRQIGRMNISMEFSTYGKRGEKIAVVVADKDTGEVIREIPSQEIQNLYAKMSELVGIIFSRQI